MNFEFEQPNSLLTTQNAQQGTTSLDPSGIIDGLSKFLSFGIGDVLDLPSLQDKDHYTATDETHRSLNGVTQHKSVQHSTSQLHRNGNKQPMSSTDNPTTTRQQPQPSISQREKQAQEELYAAAQQDQDLQVHLRKLLKDTPAQPDVEEHEDSQQPAMGLSLEGFFNGFTSIKQRATTLLDTLDAKFDSMFNPGEDEITASAASQTQRHAAAALTNGNSPTGSNTRVSEAGSDTAQANNSSQQSAKLVVNANRNLKGQTSIGRAKLNAKPLCNKNPLQSPSIHKRDSKLTDVDKAATRDGTEAKPRAVHSIAISKPVPFPHQKPQQAVAQEGSLSTQYDRLTDAAGVPDQNPSNPGVTAPTQPHDHAQPHCEAGCHHGNDHTSTSHQSLATHQSPSDELQVQNVPNIIQNDAAQQQSTEEPQPLPTGSQPQGVHQGVVVCSNKPTGGSLSALLDPSCAGCSVTKRLLKAASKKVNDLAADNARLRGAALLDPVLSDSICAQLQSLLSDKARLLLDNCRLQREVAGLQQLLAYTWEQQTMWLDEDTAGMHMAAGSPAVPIESNNGIYFSPIDSRGIPMGVAPGTVIQSLAGSTDRNSAGNNINATDYHEVTVKGIVDNHEIDPSILARQLILDAGNKSHPPQVRHVGLPATEQPEQQPVQCCDRQSGPQACLLDQQPCQQSCQSSTQDEIAEIHQYYSELLADLATPQGELPDWLATPAQQPAVEQVHNHNHEQHSVDGSPQPRRLFHTTSNNGTDVAESSDNPEEKSETIVGAHPCNSDVQSDVYPDDNANDSQQGCETGPALGNMDSQVVGSTEQSCADNDHDG